MPYTYPHWLYDVSTYLVYNLFGLTGIYIATVLLTIVLGIAMYLTNVKLNKNRVISFIITLLSLYLLRTFIAARAQLVTYILFVFEIYSIERFLQTKKNRYVIFLVLISTLIANLHVAVWPFFFVLFLPYIGEYLMFVAGNLLTVMSKLKIKKFKKMLLKLKDEEVIAKLGQDILAEQTKIDKYNERQEKAREKSYKINMIKDNNIKWLVIVMLVCTLTRIINSTCRDSIYIFS